MRRIRVTGPARRDISKILQRSGAEFGDQARQRYRRLIDQALQDLSEDAARVGVQSIDDIREGYFLYHLKCSRKAIAGKERTRLRRIFVRLQETITGA